MKYKRLTAEELHALEKEFVHFLSSAQITAPDWKKMKEKELEKADELIEIFSDMVYEKVLKNIHYLEFTDKKTLNIFKCTEDKLILVGIRVKDNSPIDLTEADVFAKWNDDATAATTIVRSEKDYELSREENIFELLQSGCMITDQKRFDLLSSLVKK